MAVCYACNGTGKLTRNCVRCKGHGIIIRETRDRQFKRETCPVCNGTGSIKLTCATCNGKGGR